MNTFILKCEADEKQAKACLSAVEKEIESDGHVRSKVTLDYGEKLILKIEAVDLHALRAALNSYLRLIDMCLKLTV